MPHHTNIALTAALTTILLLLLSLRLRRYGAVKYFDLKQHPSTNYIFSYERMLDTKVRAVRALLYHLSAPPLSSRSFSLLRGTP